MKTDSIHESEVHTYVDGALTEARRQAVEAYLADRPEEAERVRLYRAQNQALKALFDPVLNEPVPAHLRALSEPAVAAIDLAKPSFLTRWSLDRIAAGVLITALGGLGGWLGHAQYRAPELSAQTVPLPRQAAVAHVVYSPDVRRPVEVAAEQEEQLVKWLSKRLGKPVQPPKLGSLGYELIGGRLLPGNSGPVAQFMYQEASGQRLTLYVTTENQIRHDTGFRFAEEGAVNVFYWVDGQFGYALSGGIAKGDLARVATAVYDQLEKK